MDGQELKEARLVKNWTQQQAAEKLGVTQAYLSMLERGRRVLPRVLARKAVQVLDAPVTALPLGEGLAVLPALTPALVTGGSDKTRSDLAALGYPGFAHLRGRRARRNPAEVLLRALAEPDLDSRVVEGLPWLAQRYADMDWDWAVQTAKLNDRQNRLGFVATLAYDLTKTVAHKDERGTRKLKEYVAVLERSRLAREDTLCHDSLTEAERRWLRVNRTDEAKHWNLLTDMNAENLSYAGN